MTMAAISGTFNLCDPDTARLQGNLDHLDVLAAACRWLDTRIITLCTGTLDPEDMWRWHPGNVRQSTWEDPDSINEGGGPDRRSPRGNTRVRARDQQRRQLGLQSTQVARRDRLTVAQGRDRPGEPDSSRRVSPATRRFLRKPSIGLVRRSCSHTPRSPPTIRFLKSQSTRKSSWN